MKKHLISSKKSLIALSAFLFSVPLLGQAQAGPLVFNCSTATGIDTLFCTVQKGINSVIPILVSLAVLIFIFGVLRYLIGSKAEDKAEGGKYMIWGIISIFVMVSVWGLVALVGRTIFGDQYGVVGSVTTAPAAITEVSRPR